MVITFIVCGCMSFPAGGYKVILEYANRFVADGFSVNIVMGAATISWKTTLGAFLKYPYHKYIRKDYNPGLWFALNNSVNVQYKFTLFERNIPASDVVIATNVESSYYLEKYRKNIKKYYFIQGFENWSVSDKKVYDSYSFDMRKIVISQWLQVLLKHHNANSTYIPNGFDFSYFSLKNNIKERDKYSILLMWHESEGKRCIDSIRALKIVKRKYPMLNIKMFGKPACPRNLPINFQYYRLPDKELHNKLYNEAAIYIAASSIEGWGLTIGEAMICGCAVACTNNPGFSILAHHEKTALLSEIYDYQGLADNIIDLIENDAKRIRIAYQANEFVKSFTWDKSYRMFLNTISE